MTQNQIFIKNKKVQTGFQHFWETVVFYIQKEKKSRISPFQNPHLRPLSYRAKDLKCKRLLDFSCWIDLGMSKSKVKFSNYFSLDPRFVKILFLLPLHRIKRPRKLKWYFGFGPIFKKLEVVRRIVSKKSKIFWPFFVEKKNSIFKKIFIIF